MKLSELEALVAELRRREPDSDPQITFWIPSEEQLKAGVDPSPVKDFTIRHDVGLDAQRVLSEQPDSNFKIGDYSLSLRFVPFYKE